MDDKELLPATVDEERRKPGFQPGNEYRIDSSEKGRLYQTASVASRKKNLQDAIEAAFIQTGEMDFAKGYEIKVRVLVKMIGDPKVKDANQIKAFEVLTKLMMSNKGGDGELPPGVEGRLDLTNAGFDRLAEILRPK
ncbi:MAG: hypothetical protein FVQ79_04140 [Planctomycetes bacterium]|nr:hypothetical protein [Planctomycetota bacterium]